jgi:hypothetical protein
MANLGPAAVALALSVALVVEYFFAELIDYLLL